MTSRAPDEPGRASERRCERRVARGGWWRRRSSPRSSRSARASSRETSGSMLAGSRDGWLRPRRDARRDDGCAESAPAARVTLDAALPLGARDVECRFALVDETADAWALDETGISRVVPLGNATRDDQSGTSRARRWAASTTTTPPTRPPRASTIPTQPSSRARFPPRRTRSRRPRRRARRRRVDHHGRVARSRSLPRPGPRRRRRRRGPLPDPAPHRAPRARRPRGPSPLRDARVATRDRPAEIRASSPSDLVELRARIAPRRRTPPRRARSKD